MSKKQEVRLMFFSGFYESIHDGEFDSEINSIIEDYDGKTYDNFRFKCDYLGYCKSYVSAISKELGMDLEFQELISPHEYNFTTDKIICYIKPKDVKKLAGVLDSPTLEKLVKERFTSRDGFMSFYSHYVDEWKEKKITKWDAVELGTLLDAWIIDNDLDLDELDIRGFEYCSGNGQYVNYTKLWDEEKEAEELKFHEDELNKLETWKKSVQSWSE